MRHGKTKALREAADRARAEGLKVVEVGRADAKAVRCGAPTEFERVLLGPDDDALTALDALADGVSKERDKVQDWLTVVDHGYYDTGEGVVLPPERPQDLGAKWCRDSGRWYIDGSES